VSRNRDAIETLTLFSTKADKLIALSAAAASVANFAWTLRVDDDGTARSSFDGPDGEQVDAFVLTLRFFIQDNEPISLRRMRELYSEVAPSGLAEQFSATCSELNAFLDSPTFIRLNGPTPLSHRQILEAFVWGDLAHSNPRHRQLYEHMQHPIGFPVFKGLLAQCFRVFSLTIGDLNTLNKGLCESLRDGG
jgi:hypothetical protein